MRASIRHSDENGTRGRNEISKEFIIHLVMAPKECA
jgi:hypothetical protein